MNKKIEIFAMTHKWFDTDKLRGSVYKPLFVGATGKDETFGYLRDDTNINISDKNCYYSELTGLYWIYQNVKDIDIVGTCHYRRYLVDENDNVLNADDITKILKDYDV
ncbi:MAG: DUF4422 domain-containing protein, partial [Lachnospiraceae bacterium]|nr:DUF4422 domain-containing protein [Lachnospiraceae bacterium]